METVLAVITLATALKDLVELGIKLKEFCDGVSKNNRELARLCERIPTDLQDMEKLYRSSANTLDQSPALKEAVGKLLWKMRRVLDKFDVLADGQPKRGANVFVKLKAAFKASDVAHEIKDLKEDISNCYQSFQILALVRIETGLQQASIVAQDTQAITAQTFLSIQKLLVLSTDQHHAVQRMKLDIQQQLRGQDTIVSDHSTSSQTTLSKRSPSSTSDYLSEQLCNIGKEISKRTADAYVNLPRIQVKEFVQHIPIQSYRRSPETRHRALLREVLTLLEGLEENAAAIDDHAYALNALGDVFSHLKMYDEACVVYDWAIDLYRILSNFQPEDYKPYLAEALSSQYWTLNQKKGSPEIQNVIDEAIAILRPMIGPNTSPDVRCQFALQLALKHYLADSKEPSTNILRDFMEALGILELILREDPKAAALFVSLDTEAELSNHLLSLFTNQNTINAQTTPNRTITSDFELTGHEAFLVRYSYVLEGAFEAHRDQGVEDASEIFLLKAVIVDWHLASTHPDTYLEVVLGRRLAGFSVDTPPFDERKLRYLEQSLKFLRKARDFDQKTYVAEWLSVLVKKARWLQELGREQEAHRTWCEILAVESMSAKDEVDVGHQALKLEAISKRLSPRHDDQVEEVTVRSVEAYYSMFKTYSWQQAEACLALALDYQRIGRHQSALQLAELSLRQFEELSLQNPSLHTHSLTSSLVLWINLLTPTGSSTTKRVFAMVTPILDRHDGLVRSEVKLMWQYCSLMSRLVGEVRDPDVVLPLSLDVVERLRRLAQQYPQDIGMRLPHTQLRHGYLLARHHRPIEAAAWLNNVRDEYRHLAFTDVEVGMWYLTLLIQLASVLRDQGELTSARAVLRSAVQTAEKLPDDANTTFWKFLVMSEEAQIEGYLGNDAVARELSVACVSMAQSNSYLVDMSVSFFLLHHSKRLIINREYNEAFHTVKETAFKIQKKLITNPTELDDQWFFWPSDFLQTWAACLADATDMSEAMAVAQQAAGDARRVWEKNTSSELCTLSESYHGSALWTLGCVQLFAGDRRAAVTAFEEVKEIWKRRSEVRKFDQRNLGMVLWGLGMVYCLLGRHEDGMTANQELKKILGGLKFSNATMHRVISVAIDQERRRPAWVKWSEGVAGELRCGHLEEVVPMQTLN